MLRNIFKNSVIILFFILILVDANAQENQSSEKQGDKNTSQQTNPNTKRSASISRTQAFTNLNSKFEALLVKSGNYKTFKVIQKDSIISFWNQTLDTLTRLRKTIATQNNTINQSQTDLEGKNEVIAKKNMEIEKNMNQVDLIEVVGIVMSKSNFKTASFILIFLLLCGLAYMAYLYKQSNIVASETVTIKEDVENLLAIEKKKRSEDIHRLKRELQTEINLVNELREKLKS